MNEVNVPLCHKCSELMVQLDLFDSRLHPAGCKLLTGGQWERGWRKDPGDQFVFQHNCPLLKDNKSS